MTVEERLERAERELSGSKSSRRRLWIVLSMFGDRGSVIEQSYLNGV